MKPPSIARISLLFGLTLGCHTRPAWLDRPLQTLPVISVSGALVFVEHNNAIATVLDPQRPSASPRTMAVGTDPVLSIARNNHPQALVLSLGSRGEQGVAPEPGSLTMIPSEATAASVRYRVGSPFNGLAQTDDGRFAVAHFRALASVGRLLYNPNEVAVVDLDQPPSATNPALRTVRSFGGVPERVVFSPPLVVHGERRTFAVVFSSAYVTLMDLAHLDRPEVTVRLTLPEDPRLIGPDQVLFDDSDATLYLRGTASNDVYVVHLDDATPDSPTGNDYRPRINQLAAGQRPTDMTLIGPAGQRRLLVVSPGSGDARVIDARSNLVTVIPLSARASNILTFTAPTARSTTPVPQALLYTPDGAVSMVSFLDLTDIDQRRGMNVEPVQLGRPVRAALSLPDRGAVMLEHPAAGTNGNLSLLDLARRSASPIVSEVSLQGASFDRDAQTLWVAPNRAMRLGFIDLATFHPGEVRVDAPVVDLIPIGATAGGARRVAAVHEDPTGYITVLDASDPSRDTALSWRGFMLEGLLDREAP